MTVYLSNRDGDGKTNEEGHYRLLSMALEGQVLGANSLKVTENTSPAMNVLVNEGDYRMETAPGEYAYMGWVDGAATVTIAAANPTNPRISVIVLYVDKQATTSAVPPNNPGIAKLMSVDGSPASSPVAPSSSAIQSAVGAGNPYMVLAYVGVEAGATTITNSNIVDERTVITVNDSILSANNIMQMVAPLLFPIGSIYTNATDNTNPATLLGFGTWAQFGQGRVPVGVDTGDTDFGAPGNTGGVKSVTLSEAQMPAHFHVANPPATTTSNNGSHTHKIMIASRNDGSGTGGDIRGANVPSNILSNYSTTNPGDHNHSVNIPQFNTSTKGSSQAHTNLQPYITVYMWRRTA